MKFKIIIIFLFFTMVGNTQSLSDLLNELTAANLELKILNNEYLTALEKAPQVSQLPDLDISAGAFPLPVETRLGAQKARLSATQMFPWFGTLDSKADLENAKAKALYERIAARQLNLFYQVKLAYYRLYELEQSQIIIKRNINLLETLERLALTKIESGKATAADALRVQLKTEELKQELDILEIAKTSPTVTINQLLNRSLQTPVKVNGHLSFALIPFNKDSLESIIKANHPTLKMFELQQDIARQSITVNALNSKPSFGLGLDYIMVGERTDSDPSNNGRDILQVRASVKIPLFKQKYAAKEREEQLNIATLDHKKEDQLLRFRSTIEKAFVDYKTAHLRMELYKKQIEITQAAINILQATYSTQGRSFDELLRLEKELIDYDLKALKAVVQSHMAKSLIERYLIEWDTN